MFRIRLALATQYATAALTARLRVAVALPALHRIGSSPARFFATVRKRCPIAALCNARRA
jgi:hypothetical protein